MLRAPESWSKYFFSAFSDFFSDVLTQKNHYKRWKNSVYSVFVAFESWSKYTTYISGTILGGGNFWGFREGKKKES